jgi:beta-hydroxylase
LIESIPSINAALFAVLPPHGTLGEHRDPFAGSLRYHLGLKTPNSDACRIYIDGTPYSWRDGQDVVFDETYIHSAKNDTDQFRIILFCDVTRPIRNRFVRAINHVMIRRVVKISAAQNREAEEIGILNGVSAYIYAAKRFFERLKEKFPTAYLIGKFAIFALIVMFIALSFV